jgi:ribosomal protein S18 acetylase RimI-like enzyme
VHNGFSAIRNYTRYGIELVNQPIVPPATDDIVFRVYKHPDDLRETARADLDAFRDHWGFSEPPFEAMVQEMEHEILEDDYINTDLWHLAVDSQTNRIVGVVLNRLQAYDQPDKGYIMTLAVLREYRQKGIATSLLYRSFLSFWERGIQGVSLHVDSDSLTGATRLYERAGMTPEYRNTRYQKILREGISVITTALET